MCGIWGISYGPEGPSAEMWGPSDLAQLMFPAIVHRGRHAWGWMAYSGADSIEFAKHVGRADTRAALSQMDLPEDAQWIVGHTRHATHGSPEFLCNNHPLLHGNIIGVHNGVIRNYMAILKVTGREDDETEVDSEAIFAAVNKWGPRGGLSRIMGDMVTVFVDRRRADVLKIARTSGRPLVIAYTEAGSLIFASEEECIFASGTRVTEPSPVRSNRILTIKQGKITHRGNIRDTEQHARQQIVSPVRAREERPAMEPVSKHNKPAVEAPDDSRRMFRTPNSNVKTQPDGTPVHGSKDLVWWNGIYVPSDIFKRLKEDEVND